MSAHPPDQSELRQLLAAVEVATVDAIFTFSADGRIRSVNDAVSEIFGVCPADLVGRELIELMPPPEAELERTCLARAGCSTVVLVVDRVCEVRGVRADGEVFPFRLAVRKVSAREKTYYVGIVHDLTHHRDTTDRILELHRQLRDQNATLEASVIERTRELEASVAELARANAELAHENAERETITRALRHRELQLERLLRKERELGELRNRFVSMASHEFRTPLTAMLSSVELLEAANPKPSRLAVKHVARIREGIGYLRNVLTDFLELGRLDGGGLELRVAPLDPLPFFGETLENIGYLAKPGQDIELEVDGELPPTSHSATGLRITLTNLLENAIKYSPPGAALDVAIRRRGDRLVIVVRDEGIGIPSSELKHLYERFYRGSNANAERGTGLGLHIVRRYVDAMGGRIRVRSTPQRGSTFTVTLPYRLAHDATTQ